VNDDESTNPRPTSISDLKINPVRVSRPGEACIVILSGPETGRRVTITSPTFEIGRAATCDLCIPQESISRQHARIDSDATSYFIEDLGSTNGTLVNDVPVRRKQLADGDLIRLGRSMLKFMTGANVEAHYHEQIYRLVTMDPLTEIHNRRHFIAELDREFNRSRRYERALSLVLFDIDHFKKVNDTFGHLAGDNVLRQVATTLRLKLRREDVFARTGGEEFGVLLPEIGIAGARATAEKCRQTIQACTFEHEGQRVPITISVGVAVLGDQMTSPEDLYRVADNHLYAAKEGGRNRVFG
jgi:diguanylate cyclase (GGDEF)-like protein